MRRKMIVLMGLDGSGKTTQAGLICDRLKAEGICARVVWMRGESYLTRPLLRMGKALLRAPKETKRGEGIRAKEAYTAYVDSKRSAFKNPLLRAIWRTLTMVDAYISLRVALSRLERATEVVVLDRYVYDTMIDIDSAFAAEGLELDRLLGSAWLRLFPKPRAVILLEITPEEAMRRKDDIPSLNYLTERHGLYQRTAEAVGGVSVDGTRPIDEITSEIMGQLQGVIKWQA